METTKKEATHCEGCTFWRRLSSGNPHSIRVCHYLLDTFKLRGGSAATCTRKILKEAF